MRKIFIILIMAIMASGCVAGRELGRLVESTIVTIPQKISPVGSPSRGAYLAKVYPSGQYAIAREGRYIAMDGFSELNVVHEHTDGSNDYIFLSGTTTEGTRKTFVFLSPSNVMSSGFFEIPRFSSKPFEVQKDGSNLRFIQENDYGDAYIVSSINSYSPTSMNTAMVPKADVKPAAAALVPAPSPYFGKPAAPTATKPSAAPSKASTTPAKAPAGSTTYGISLPPLDAYTTVKVDRSGSAKVDTSSSTSAPAAKPQLVLD
jgi:hypothetical protein